MGTPFSDRGGAIPVGDCAVYQVVNFETTLISRGFFPALRAKDCGTFRTLCGSDLVLLAEFSATFSPVPGFDYVAPESSSAIVLRPGEDAPAVRPAFFPIAL